jgi:carboxyl-terminal processing protease
VRVRRRTGFLLTSVLVLVGVGAVASGAAEVATKGLYRLVGMMGQVVGLVRSSYVEEVPVDRLELGAMAGLVEAADPGGAWVPADQANDYRAAIQRPLGQYGLVLGKRASYPYVLEVLPDSAGARAGLTPGEYIERIDGVAVRARPLWLAQVLLDRAEQAGKKVELDAIDRYLEGKRRVALEPSPTPSPVAQVSPEGGVPVVRVRIVDKATAAKLATELTPFATADALVVDLRGVALGSPNGALALAGSLVGGDTSLVMARHGGAQETMKAARPPHDWRVVVCVDGTTAGPAELVAVALKQRGATLVGNETYGDTGERSAQAGAGGELWLADRWFVGPDGKALLGSGVKPDELVRSRKGADTVLERALELAHGQKTKAAA